eukprot:11443399-Alexandrium_andersonii.AAC.1
MQKGMLHEQRELSPTLGVGATGARAQEHGDTLIGPDREDPTVLKQESICSCHVAGLTRAGCVVGAV